MSWFDWGKWHAMVTIENLFLFLAFVLVILNTIALFVSGLYSGLKEALKSWYATYK